MATPPVILFIHQNYPGQFGGISRYLAAEGWQVHFASAAEAIKNAKRRKDHGVNLHFFSRRRAPIEKGQHHYLSPLENAVLNGQGLANTALGLKEKGLSPDIVVAHSGWGSGSFVKSVWPEAKFVPYIEWWYNFPPRDEMLFDGSKMSDIVKAERRSRALCNNLPFLLDWHQSDGMMIPTKWQADAIPAYVKAKAQILHDGVDTTFFSPGQPGTRAAIPNADLPDDAQLITFATRGMEKHRGFPQFMAALSLVQQSHKKVHCVVAGTDTVHYGTKLPEGDSYKTRALAAHEFDHSRLHFVGKLPPASYRDLLRRSDAHVYLTVPFILSWSLVDAMATGCPIITNPVPPVLEALPHDKLARFADFYSPAAIADAIRALLDNPDAARSMGLRARNRALRHYDRAEIYPKRKAYLEEIMGANIPM